MSNLTLKSVEKEINAFLEEAYQVQLTQPIKINNRLKRALGRFKYYNNSQLKEKNYIEISGSVWRYGTNEMIMGVLKHEAIHFALYHLGKPFNDGHPIFEAELEKHNAPSTQVLEYVGETHVYQCTKCKEKINVGHRRLNKNKRYACIKCKEPVTYYGKELILPK